MKIETKYHGTIDLRDNDIITIDQGLPGFAGERKFAILPFGEDSLFNILQSVETSDLAFVITTPFLFFKDYEFNIPNPIRRQLKIEKEQNVLTYVILTVQDPFEKTTANLKAPLIINAEANLGKQLVLNDDAYETKHLLIQQQPLTSTKGEK
ncbi:flagellar assembly protein FliW [Alkalihalobacillus sp. AL-G]|uniref:flagellar assembly protein FliW n=1 Tax=Alkalihalobacillus sp. AL-G TaxID=2926399 RepID=UPI00272B3473|nr:flagellar assembly protein FliW [Alkalihalobacillus sp. AL-G]WLD92972.1 flagellar assembly protein FliW [Alkalihalobacillus sp. AL-G]